MTGRGKKNEMEIRRYGENRKGMNRGKKIFIGYGRIKIEEKWWKWIEEEEVLMDKKGTIKEESKGEDMMV